MTLMARRGRAAAGADGDKPKAPAFKLTPYEGKSVLSATVAITRAGDGLSKAMTVEPVEFHHGQRVQVVLDCEVEKIRYDPIPDTDGLQRVHILKAGTATFIDDDAVRTALDEQEKRIEEASGVHRLPLPTGPDGGSEPDPDSNPDE